MRKYNLCSLRTAHVLSIFPEPLLLVVVSLTTASGQRPAHNQHVMPALRKLGMLEHVCSCRTTDVCQRNVDGESLK
jgi:hypothetical protein